MGRETWRYIAGYEGIYQVSNFGNIRSVDRLSADKHGNLRRVKGRHIKGRTWRTNHVRVGLKTDGREVTEYVDELVAGAFCGDKPNCGAVLHVDGDMLNNKADNLMWVTSESLREMWKDGSGLQPRMLPAEHGEEWRDVVGYEGEYKASSLGRVMMLDEVVTYRGRRVVIHARLAKTYKNNDGYVKVNLTSPTSHKTVSVHRIVAHAFIPNPSNAEEVDHVDCVRDNNCVGNLRWVTKRENFDHMVTEGHLRIAPLEARRAGVRPKGAVGRCVPLIRNDGKRYESISSAASDLGCSQSMLHRHLRGIHKTCKGYTLRRLFA